MTSLRPSRKLGQHFLIDKRYTTWFRERVCGSRAALEIGVGTASITTSIGECVGFLVGLEIDTRLIPHIDLSMRAFKAVFELVLSNALLPPIRLKGFDVVYGSIPYNITGPLLSTLVKFYQGRTVLILQKEVVDRLRAKPGTSQYGRLTVLVNLVYNVLTGPTIPPKAFKPKPRVYSQLVELLPHSTYDIEKIGCIEKLTACLFSERRKRAIKVIRKCVGNLSMNIPSDKRVYQLTIDEIVAIAEAIGWCRDTKIEL